MKHRNVHALNAAKRHAGFHVSERRGKEKTDYLEESSDDKNDVCMHWKGYRSPKCGSCSKCSAVVE